MEIPWGGRLVRWLPPSHNGIPEPPARRRGRRASRWRTCLGNRGSISTCLGFAMPRRRGRRCWPSAFVWRCRRSWGIRLPSGCYCWRFCFRPRPAATARPHFRWGWARCRSSIGWQSMGSTDAIPPNDIVSAVFFVILGGSIAAVAGRLRSATIGPGDDGRAFAAAAASRRHRPAVGSRAGRRCHGDLDLGHSHQPRARRQESGPAVCHEAGRNSRIADGAILSGHPLRGSAANSGDHAAGTGVAGRVRSRLPRLSARRLVPLGRLARAVRVRRGGTSPADVGAVGRHHRPQAG